MRDDRNARTKCDGCGVLMPFSTPANDCHGSHALLRIADVLERIENDLCVMGDVSDAVTNISCHLDTLARSFRRANGMSEVES